MGRGRAPCCDKSQVVRGPWSPAEDHRLISYIQKYGHDNWRSLPKQAGLLRCGKSCRLRWINYLRPDLKRGNFSKKEEESIIQLHQTIGNKWSRIAAHFPGRTDNEIKNVWNTHLKKRLTKKVVEANNKQDETSVITSSSSSSTTAESSPKNHKTEIQSQIKLLPCDGSQAKTDEMIAPQHQDSESLGASIDQPTHINHLVQFTVWEDPNLLESLLSAVDDLEWILAPQLDSTENNTSRELHMESDIDLWSMLNNDDQPAPAKPVDKEAEQVYTVEAPMTENNINADAYITDKDIDIMFEYLDNEPGLSMEMYQGDDLNRGSPTAAATGNGIPSMDYFPIWPQSQT